MSANLGHPAEGGTLSTKTKQRSAAQPFPQLPQVTAQTKMFPKSWYRKRSRVLLLPRTGGEYERWSSLVP